MIALLYLSTILSRNAYTPDPSEVADPEHRVELATNSFSCTDCSDWRYQKQQDLWHRAILVLGRKVSHLAFDTRKSLQPSRQQMTCLARSLKSQSDDYRYVSINEFRLWLSTLHSPLRWNLCRTPTAVPYRFAVICDVSLSGIIFHKFTV